MHPRVAKVNRMTVRLPFSPLEGPPWQTVPGAEVFLALKGTLEEAILCVHASVVCLSVSPRYHAEVSEGFTKVS